ncbi:MAG TPA: RNA polymerase sigma factor [Rhizomicrobium sp.]|nr:RNA polymerase sigma factor [Rhizomicrobium sp.]
MAEIPDTSRDGAERCLPGVAMTPPEVRAWFVREVLPLEAVLMQFLRRNWRNKAEIADLRQDVYVRVFEAARQEIPRYTKPFLFTTARNLLINRMRQAQIVSIEAVADLESLNIAKDEPGPDRSLIAREDLRRLQAALDHLPPRCREAVILRQVDGLSRQEIAARMGIAEKTVKRHLADGVRALADHLYSDVSARTKS